MQLEDDTETQINSPLPLSFPFQANNQMAAFGLLFPPPPPRADFRKIELLCDPSDNINF